MRLRPSIVVIAMFGVTGCATFGVQQPSARAVQVMQAQAEAQAAFEKTDFDALREAIARATAAAGDDVELLDRAKSLQMAMLIEHDDVESAAKLMTERLEALDAAHRFSHNQHDEAIFVAEARGDAATATLEASEMMATTSRLKESTPLMWLGNWWQRAHTLRALAQVLQEPARTAVLSYARQARKSFEALATELKESLGSIAVLTEQFASLDGDCALALRTAKSLKLDDLDPQDAYITALAFETCGDADAGAAVRKHILANREFGLFQSFYRYLARTKR